ncbi:nucleotide sugar dehydrogenase [bacterium]|nr:nucleotide sugar dehydrogenase [bacterium]
MHAKTKLQELLQEGKATITVVGLGYVGLPLALGFAQRGFTVLGLDDDTTKVERLLKGIDYINGQDSIVQSVVASGNLKPTRDFQCMGESDVIVICVPTPLTKNREPNISYVVSVAKRIGQLIRPGSLVVLESTTYPGTTAEVVLPLVLEGGRVQTVGEDFFLAFSPERVDPGNPSYHTYNTTKVVGGLTENCTDLTACLYQALLERSDLVKRASSAQAAELEKLFENIFRSVNIALVNELALLCNEMGLNVWEILDLASSKPFGFMRFNPGPGIGGHCIPLDPFYLTWKAREFDFPTQFIELAGQLNSRMPNHVVDLTVQALGTKGLKESSILLLGLAYKKDVADHRESPALRVLELLESRGAKVSYLDPLLPEVRMGGKTWHSASASDIAKADCCILMTDHSDFDVDTVLSQAKVLVDTRGWTQGHDIQKYSCRVVCLGGGTLPSRTPVGASH